MVVAYLISLDLVARRKRSKPHHSY